MQDEGGTEDLHIYAVTIATGETRDLTPIAGVQARIHDMSLDEPNIVAIEINDRDKSWHDLYRIDVRTGERELLFENRAGALPHRARPPAAPAARLQDPHAGRRPHPLPHRRQQARADRRRRARGRSDDLHHRLHARRQDALRHLVRRPRHGGAARHRLGDGQGARAGRAPEGRHRPRHRPSPDVRHRGRRRPAPDAGLDPARGAHGRRPEAAARPAPGRGQHRRPHARRQPLDRRRERGGGAGHLSSLRARAPARSPSCSPRGPISSPIGWRRCAATSFARATGWSWSPI